MQNNRSYSRNERFTCQQQPYRNMPVHVPWQTWEDTYDVHKGLECGTIFPVLNKPFYGKGGCNQ